MKKFSTPQYQDTFRYNWEFEKYGDKSNFWIEVDYFINRENFSTRVSSALNFDLRAENGEKIFRNMSASKLATLQSRSYKLLNEDVVPANIDEDILKVKELYGYAPNAAYELYTVAPVHIWGIEDELSSISGPKNISEASLNEMETYLSFKVESLDDGDYAVGDNVKIIRPYYRSGAYTGYMLYSPVLSIISVNGIDGDDAHKRITVANFEFISSADGGYVETKAVNFINAGGSSIPFCYMYKTGRLRYPSTKISSIRNVITYHTQLPQLEERFIVAIGGKETNTITPYTIPNVTEWEAKVARGEYVNIQDSEVNLLYPSMYQKTLKQTLAR